MITSIDLARRDRLIAAALLALTLLRGGAAAAEALYPARANYLCSFANASGRHHNTMLFQLHTAGGPGFKSGTLVQRISNSQFESTHKAQLADRVNIPGGLRWRLELFDKDTNAFAARCKVDVKTGNRYMKVFSCTTGYTFVCNRVDAEFYAALYEYMNPPLGDYGTFLASIGGTYDFWDEDEPWIDRFKNRGDLGTPTAQEKFWDKLEELKKLLFDSPDGLCKGLDAMQCINKQIGLAETCAGCLGPQCVALDCRTDDTPCTFNSDCRGGSSCIENGWQNGVPVQATCGGGLGQTCRSIFDCSLGSTCSGGTCVR